MGQFFFCEIVTTLFLTRDVVLDTKKLVLRLEDQKINPWSLFWCWEIFKTLLLITLLFSPSFCVLNVFFLLQFFLCLYIFYVLAILFRPVKSHSGARENILVWGPPNIFEVPFWGENFWIVLSKMVHSDVLYISERWRGPQTSRARGNFPPYPTLSTVWLFGVSLNLVECFSRTYSVVLVVFSNQDIVCVCVLTWPAWSTLGISGNLVHLYFDVINDCRGMGYLWLLFEPNKFFLLLNISKIVS